MTAFVGGCAIAGARFAGSARLPELSGTRSEAHRYASLCQDLLPLELSRTTVPLIDSAPRNHVYAQFETWVRGLREGAAIVLIATHAFQGRRGLVFQCEDSIAEHREYTGVKLFDLYEIVATSPVHFYFIIECCRTRIYKDMPELDDFHPKNVTVAYSCGFGEETLDWNEGAAALLRTIICDQVSTSPGTVNFHSLLDELQARAAIKGKKVQIVGKAPKVDLLIGPLDASKHQNERNIVGVEMRTFPVNNDRLQPFLGAVNVLRMRARIGEAPTVHYERIDITDTYRIWTSENFNASFYDIVASCVESAANVISIEVKFSDEKTTARAMAQLKRRGFMSVEGVKDALFSSYNYVQQRAQLGAQSIIFTFSNVDATPIAIDFNKFGVFEFIANLE